MKRDIWYTVAGLLLLAMMFPATVHADHHGKKMRRGKSQPGKSIIHEFCAANPQDNRCEELQERREKRMICKNDPNSEACAAIRAERWKRRQEMKKKCEENPDTEKCQWLRERHQKRSGRQK